VEGGWFCFSLRKKKCDNYFLREKRKSVRGGIRARMDAHLVVGCCWVCFPDPLPLTPAAAFPTFGCFFFGAGCFSSPSPSGGDFLLLLEPRASSPLLAAAVVAASVRCCDERGGGQSGGGGGGEGVCECHQRLEVPVFTHHEAVVHRLEDSDEGGGA
jgi:hypothetical protein